MILASLSFSLMVACVKLVRAELDPLHVVFWRAAIATPMLVIPVIRGPGFRLGRRKAFVSRLLFGFIAMTCFYTAAKGLALVDLSLISRLQPILLAVMAPLVLGRDERAQPGVWLAAAIGFSGCALILGPSLAVGTLWGAWALAATFASACAHLSLRRVASADAGMTIVFWFHLGMLGLAALGLGLEGEAPRLPSGPLLWPLLALGLLATAGQLFMTRAYSLERAPVVAAASYSAILFSLLLDLIVFGLLPTLAALAGGSLVVGSSLWLVLRGGRAKPPPESRL
jgi:drug/metabolite transporter (DMT)-like permease